MHIADKFKHLLIHENFENQLDISEEQRIFIWTQEHGLGGFLERHMDAFKLPQLRQLIKDSARQNSLRNILMLAEYEKIREICRMKGLPELRGLKGISFLKRLYSPSVRTLTDIDVLGRPHLREEYVRMLLDQGYSPLPETKWSANAHKISFKKNVSGLEITVELHDQLTASAESADLAYSENSEVELVYLCGHLAHQHSFLKVFWLLDIYFLSLRNPHLWNPKTMSIARQLRLENAVKSVAHCLHNMFSLSLPMVDLQPSFLLKTFLTWESLLDLHQKRFLYLGIKHLTKDSLLEAAYYDMEWLLSGRTKNHSLKLKSNRDADL